MVAAPSILEKPHSRAAAQPVDNWLADWSQQGWLTMKLTDVREAHSLEAWLMSTIDRELSQLGAGPRPPYVGPTARDVLEDQIYRAKMLGFQGLAIVLPTLSPWADGGVLPVEQSRALLAWCQAAIELDAPLRLSDDDADLAVYLPPVPLGQAAVLRFPVVSAPSPPVSLVQRVAPPVSDVERAVNQSPLTGATETEPAPPPENRRISSVETLAPVPNNVSRRAAMKSLLEEDDADETSTNDAGHFAPSDRRGPSLVGRAPADAREHSSTPAAALARDPVALTSATEPAASPVVSPDRAGSQQTTDILVSGTTSDVQWSELTDLRFEEPPAVPALRAPADLTLSVDDDAFAEHVESLQTSGGSHGWEGIEALFEAHYLPLQKAVRDGAAPPLAAAILAEWAKDFAEGYERAFDAIRNNRGKRPRLVLDAPSYAFQLGRKHNADHLKMVLVDAMRADIGPIVRDKLRLQMANTAECVASGLLWSAMPANTAAQMELIARGTDGLRHFSGELTETQLMSRGNDLRRLRPVRVGSHRMYKLDIVQYLTRDAERYTSDNLEQYAAEVATSVGRFLRQQEPGTLVYLFGDHGFGGLTDASPEQILTPYQAWLLSH
jgi:hypothetical protein